MAATSHTWLLEHLKYGHCEWETQLLVSVTFNLFKFKGKDPHMTRGYIAHYQIRVSTKNNTLESEF
jgi:hypothetical protein